MTTRLLRRPLELPLVADAAERVLLGAAAREREHAAIRRLGNHQCGVARQERTINLLPFANTESLIVDDGRCVGVRFLDPILRSPREIYGKAVIMCTGGAGQLYQHTTNPPVATGDGMAMEPRSVREWHVQPRTRRGLPAPDEQPTTITNPDGTLPDSEQPFLTPAPSPSR